MVIIKGKFIKLLTLAIDAVLIAAVKTFYGFFEHTKISVDLDDAFIRNVFNYQKLKFNLTGWVHCKVLKILECMEGNVKIVMPNVIIITLSLMQYEERKQK